MFPLYLVFGSAGATRAEPVSTCFPMSIRTNGYFINDFIDLLDKAFGADDIVGVQPGPEGGMVRMQWVATLLGATRAKILDLLRRSAASIPEVAKEVGITGNAVRGHVAALQRDGLVKAAGSSPSTGGKPAQLYEITGEAEELYPKAYALVLRALIDRHRSRHGQDATLELLQEVGREVARQTTDRASDQEGHVQAAAEVLRGLGSEIKVVRVDDAWELRGVGCPLSAVVLEEPTACSLAQALIAEVTKAEVKECCDRSGDRARCVFRVRERSRSPRADPPG